MVNKIGILLSLLWSSLVCANDDFYYAGMSVDDEVRISEDLNWLKSFSSNRVNVFIKKKYSVNAGSGVEIREFILKRLPILVGESIKPNVCGSDHSVQDKCKGFSFAERNVALESSTLVSIEGNSFALWVPYFDSMRIKIKNPIINFSNSDLFSVNKVNDTVVVLKSSNDFLGPTNSLSKEARSILSASSLFGLAVLSNSLKNNSSPLDQCLLAGYKFYCNKDYDGYFTAVSLMISELSTGCSNCTEFDLLVLSYLVSFNAMSSVGNKVVYERGIKIYKDNESNYLKFDFNMTPLKNRYRYLLIK